MSLCPTASQNWSNFIFYFFTVHASVSPECSFHSGSSRIHSASLPLERSVLSSAFKGRSPKFTFGYVLVLTVCRPYRALGVVPIFLAEISPPAFRTTFLGVTYQLGNMVASNSRWIEGGRWFFRQRLDFVCSSSILSYRKTLAHNLPRIARSTRSTKLRLHSGYLCRIHGCVHRRPHFDRP